MKRRAKTSNPRSLTSVVHLMHCHVEDCSKNSLLHSPLLVNKMGSQLLNRSQLIYGQTTRYPNVLPNSCGAPQGAVRSLFFFTLHTSNLYSELMAFVLKYEEDVVVRHRGISIIENVSQWSWENGLASNTHTATLWHGPSTMGALETRLATC